jgi:hypothetical protein
MVNSKPVLWRIFRAPEQTDTITRRANPSPATHDQTALKHWAHKQGRARLLPYDRAAVNSRSPLVVSRWSRRRRLCWRVSAVVLTGDYGAGSAWSRRRQSQTGALLPHAFHLARRCRYGSAILLEPHDPAFHRGDRSASADTAATRQNLLDALADAAFRSLPSLSPVRQTPRLTRLGIYILSARNWRMALGV